MEPPVEPSVEPCGTLLWRPFGSYPWLRAALPRLRIRKLGLRFYAKVFIYQLLDQRNVPGLDA